MSLPLLSNTISLGSPFPDNFLMDLNPLYQTLVGDQVINMTSELSMLMQSIEQAAKEVAEDSIDLIASLPSVDIYPVMPSIPMLIESLADDALAGVSSLFEPKVSITVVEPSPIDALLYSLSDNLGGADLAVVPEIPVFVSGVLENVSHAVDLF